MRHALALSLLLAATPVLAEPPEIEDGVLNPDELSLDSVIGRAMRGDTSMMVCAQGYLVTKQGNHALAREIFEACAAAGYTGAMTWMSQLDGNGLGAPEDLEAAAEWDRRAADLGDPVGKFNRGLDLLRGHGVAQDRTSGQRLIDEAASAGLKSAQTLRDAEYDTDVVTPDSDNHKYMRLF